MNSISSREESEPSTQCRHPFAGCFRQTILAILFLAVATELPARAQATNSVDDGTVLRQLILFGRHSIRSSVTSSNVLQQDAVDAYPPFVGVPIGYLTPNGRLAAGLLGSYFRAYLIHEGLLTGDATTDLAVSYFRANTIERSYITARDFGSGLVPGAGIPVHTYAAGTPDPVFDPLSAGVATVDPARAVMEAQGIFGSGSNLMSAYSGELSLISKVLYPSGTAPINGAAQGSVDPTKQMITLVTNWPQTSGPPYAVGEVIDMGGLDSTVSAADPFVMQYADGFPSNEVAWGRLSLDALSQQTRLVTLQFNICMRPPYLARVQSSSAASHILRSMLQVTGGTPLDGALGTPASKVLVVVSSDAYVSGLAGLLNMHWLLPGYQPDFCAPGGALVFELRPVKTTGQYLVRAYYTAQTFDQLRHLTPLTLGTPPATQQLLIPGGNSITNLDVEFTTFTNLLNAAIGMEYVQPFAAEVPPPVQDPYTADNPTNLTASAGRNTITIAWPADHIGWMLQVQTNGSNSGHWFDVPGSETVNAVVLPKSPAHTSVFYRQRRQ